MELICAIDLLDGGAVRLVQGDYERRVAADASATDLARRFVRAGCPRLHIVDLAGARDGTPRQLPLVAAVAAAAREIDEACIVESSGGLRTGADVDAALEVADEVLLGTAAVEDPTFLAGCAARHPGRIGASLDLRDGRAALDGWLRIGAGDPVDLARALLDAGASRLVVTDTRRDGTLSGPDIERIAALRAALPDATLVAAGGVGSLDDLRALSAIGVDGAVVGIALLSGAVDVAGAVEALR